MGGLSVAISLEPVQATISCTVRVAHENHTTTSVQIDGEPDLFDDEVTFEIIAWGSQRLGATRNHDHIGLSNCVMLQELAYRQIDSMIKTAKHRRPSHIRFRCGVKVKDFAHRHILPALPSAIHVADDSASTKLTWSLPPWSTVGNFGPFRGPGPFPLTSSAMTQDRTGLLELAHTFSEPALIMRTGVEQEGRRYATNPQLALVGST